MTFVAKVDYWYRPSVYTCVLFSQARSVELEATEIGNFELRYSDISDVQVNDVPYKIYKAGF